MIFDLLRKKTKLYNLLLLTTILAGLLFYLLPGIIQLFQYGFTFYVNGADEVYYLNYSFALKTVGISRYSEYLIIFLHNLGLNGGLINILLDFISLSVFSWFIYKILMTLFPKANFTYILYSLLIILFLPITLSHLNPIIAKICNFIAQDELLRNYIVWNHTPYPVYLRTPESQVSLMIFILSFWLSIRFKKPLLILLTLPFLYFFVSIFIAVIFSIYYISLFVEHRFKIKKLIDSVIFTSLIIFILVGACLYLLYQLFPQKELSLATRLPIFGVSMLILFLTIIACKVIFVKTILSSNNQRFILSVITGIFIVYNTQIISGTIIQPQHFELEVCLIPGIIIAVFLLNSSENNSLMKRLIGIITYMVIIVSIAYFLRFTYHSTMYLIKRFSVLLETSNIKSDLILQSEKVAINDPSLSAGITGLYLNKGSSMASSFNNIFFANDSIYINYLSFKNYIYKQDSSVINSMKPIIDAFDQGYADKFNNFLPIYVSRRGKIFTKYNIPKQIPEKVYKIYLIK